MKQLEPRTVTVGENKFYIRPLPAFKAANLTGELAALVLPIVSGLAPLLDKVDSGKEGKGLMDLNIEDAAPAISGAFSSLSGDKLEAILKHLLIAGKNIAFETPEDEKPRVLTEDLANEVFCEDVQDMFLLSSTKTENTVNTMDCKEKRPPESGLYPYFYPLQPQNPGNIRPHTGGAFLLHRLCNVAVNVQRESCGCVAQIPLNRLYIVPGADSCDSVGVAQIVERSGRHTDRGGHPLERLIDHEGGQKAAQFIREHKPPIFPCAASPETVFSLFPPVLTQKLHDMRGRGDYTAFTVFGACEYISPGFPVPLELLINADRPPLEVNAIPQQAQQFPFPHTREKRNSEQRFKPMTLYGLQKCAHSLTVKRRFLFGLFPGEGTD